MYVNQVLEITGAGCGGCWSSQLLSTGPVTPAENQMRGFPSAHSEDVKDAIRRLSSPKDVNLEKIRRKEKPAFQRGHLGSQGTSLFLLVHCLFGKAGGVFIPN